MPTTCHHTFAGSLWLEESREKSHMHKVFIGVLSLCSLVMIIWSLVTSFEADFLKEIRSGIFSQFVTSTYRVFFIRVASRLVIICHTPGYTLHIIVGRVINVPCQTWATGEFSVPTLKALHVGLWRHTAVQSRVTAAPGWWRSPWGSPSERAIPVVFSYVSTPPKHWPVDRQTRRNILEHARH